jgi:hypothetical protein
VLRIRSIYYYCLLPVRLHTSIILRKNGAPYPYRRIISIHLPRRSVGISELFGNLEHICSPTRCNSFLRNQGIKLSAVSISVISKATTSRFASIVKSKDPEKRLFSRLVMSHSAATAYSTATYLLRYYTSTTSSTGCHPQA